MFPAGELGMALDKGEVDAVAVHQVGRARAVAQLARIAQPPCVHAAIGDASKQQDADVLAYLLNFNKFAWTVSFFAIRVAILLT